MTRQLFFILAATFSMSSAVYAQSSTLAKGKCSGRIYSPKEVTRRAKLTTPLEIQITEEARTHAVHGRITIEAVLCRNGRVTEMRVIEGLPWGMTENALQVVSKLGFTPAELNSHTVSQRMRFEFGFNDDGGEKIDPTAARGRLVEEVDVIGNRQLTKDQILGWIKTRAGDTFNPDQITRDLLAINASGYFYGERTRVTMEDAIRGGVRVIFEVMELPLIKEIKIEGIKNADQAAILEVLRKPNVNVETGSPLDSVKLTIATRAIEVFLSRNGWLNAKAEAFVENISATEVTITFKLSGYNFRS